MGKQDSKHSKRRQDSGEIKLKGPNDERLDAAMRDAVAAVEARRSDRKRPGDEGREATDEIPIDDQEDLDREAEVEQLQRELASLKDVSIRTLADFDNFRKRTERERKDLLRYSAEQPMREFLPVIDNLERALAAGGSVDDLKTGVEMILQQMSDLLRRFKVEPVPALGERFDPTVHEAVLREESDEVEEPTVTAELQRGYTLHDRLIRPAMVKVAMPAKRSEKGS